MVIPEGIIEIGQFAFRGCTTLTSITLPNSITTIGAEAFARSGLTSINWPARATTIQSNIFNGCTNLETVLIAEGIINIRDGVFKGCTALTNINLPSTISNIGQEAFHGCSSLTTIIIPDSVQKITFGSNVFQGCRSLLLAPQAVLRRLGYIGGF